MKRSPVDREEYGLLISRADSDGSISDEDSSRTELDAAEKITKKNSPLQHARALQTLQVFVLNTMIPLMPHPQNKMTAGTDKASRSRRLPSCITSFRVALFSLWIAWMLVIPRYVTDMATSLFLNAVHPYDMQRFVLKERVLHPEWHPATRKERFPSAEERLKDYMGDWYYLPPCPDYTNGKTGYRTIGIDESSDAASPSSTTSVQLLPPRYDVPPQHSEEDTMIELQHNIIPDAVFVLDEDVVKDCARPWFQYNFDHWIRGEFLSQSAEQKARVSKRMNMRVYCDDCMEMFDLVDDVNYEAGPPSFGIRGSAPATSSHSISIRNGVPLLVQSGDRDGTNPDLGSIPVFKKFRRLATYHESSSAVADAQTCRSRPPPLDTPAPRIIWKLNSRRHYHPLYLVPYEDTIWEKKKNVAVWRGAVTGYLGNSTDYLSISEEQLCLGLIPRCKFVYENGKSTLLDAKFHKNVGNLLPKSLEGVSLFASPLSKRQLMSYKAIIILEGNDVSSALKWALFCASVVIMPRPTNMSWAMEHRLVPWTHYIPLDNMSQAEERMQWVLENEEEARKISERATLFIYDLMFHPDAMADDLQVKEEMLTRYQQYFQKISL